jgi:hypothetical protein
MATVDEDGSEEARRLTAGKYARMAMEQQLGSRSISRENVAFGVVVGGVDQESMSLVEH